MRCTPRIILTLTLCSAAAIFAGCAPDDPSHTEHADHRARAAPNPCADKTKTPANPCGEKAANPCNPCGDKAARDDGAFDPWGDQDQPSNKDKQQPTEAPGSWW